jgi:aspartyl-tRNA(Asn)/glutamyl-tRNA(Gln) amidotransferase subunit A
MNITGFASVQAALADGLSFTQLVSWYLERIEKRASLNAFLEVYREEALSQAALLDKKKQSGQPLGRLAGVVLGVKDNILHEGHKVSASSRILEGFTSVYTATALSRLLAEDVIVIGRLNCDEFAMGSSNEQSAFGPVKNPVNETRVPGGSSGGSAAAVAAGLCTAALGSDTGGSIRQPAAFCGVVGIKPTYGRISRYGLIAYGSSFDQIGPITHNVEDAALLTNIMSGPDGKDLTAIAEAPEKYHATPLKAQHIAVYRVVMDHPSIDPHVLALFKKQIQALEGLGHTISYVDFPYLDYLVPTYYVLSTAEASSNLSRFDGIHYGYRTSHPQNLEETYRKSRSEGFGKEVKRRIMTGTFVLSSGYYDAYYHRGQQVRQLIRKATDDILATHDFIMSPTSPGFAFPFGGKAGDPVAMYLEDIFTVQANLSGHPAISIPMGSYEGLPAGLQFLGPRKQENKLFAMAEQCEKFNA